MTAFTQHRPHSASPSDPGAEVSAPLFPTCLPQEGDDNCPPTQQRPHQQCSALRASLLTMHSARGPGLSQER